ncbi:hypothetical protein FACS1894155_05930 [Bacteroidia bacterium]|nr:hypothetical protein FACS1894155_05930 [Bacteroidia bacterium]
MKILFLPEVMDYFLELADILYEKNYFGFENSALEYAEDLFEDISENLPNKHRKLAPNYFDRYGENMNYSAFKRNKNTSWYVFFNIYFENGETVYFVRYISNQ